jgi:hypothetical protein
MSALVDIAAERRRQVEQEGWTPEHDDEHVSGELVKAAIGYASDVIRTDEQRLLTVSFAPPIWPWDAAWWKPSTRRRDLVKAGALIVAEIERLDRAALKGDRE